MTRLTLLGTGGGRFATVTQERATGGVYLEDGVSLHIDPGPGSLVMMKRARLDPMRTDGILVSHCHPDHYTDAEVLLEAMTNGTQTQRGFLLRRYLTVSARKLFNRRMLNDFILRKGSETGVEII